MMRRRIGIYGASDEVLALLPLLDANPAVEIAVIFDPDPGLVRERLRALGSERMEFVGARLTDDPKALSTVQLHAVIDSGLEPSFVERFPDAAARGVQIVAPLTARLLFGYGVSARDRKAELLQALHEVVESVNLTVDADELFARMLEIALGVTGADRGSLMLLDPQTNELTIRVAVGIEPELWSKIRVPLGEGIAGRVAADARALRLRGKADRQAFRIVRERLDVESALSVPLVHQGKVLGVLNLHHGTRPDVFADADLEFVEQLAHLDAQIIARAQEHAALRDQAVRYAAVREVREILGGRAPLLERLTRLCKVLAARAGNGIATVYLHDPDDKELRLAATSLSGGGFGGEYRVTLGQGIDGRVASDGRPAFLRSAGDALAFAALPLLAGETLVGVLSVQAGSPAPRGRAAEETLLEVAAAAADEIAQAEREARMTARATQVSAINETGIRMITATDPADVVRLATSSAAMVLEADHAILRLQDDTTGRFVIRSYFGSADGRLQEKLFRLDKRVSVDAIKRRTAFAVRDVTSDPALEALGTGVRSLVAAPLKRDGRVIGTMALYDKVAADRFSAGAFNDDDLGIFAKFVSYVERAVANAILYAHTRQHKSFDEDTGLPNAAYLMKRIDEEIARGSGRSGRFAIATCRIENLEAIVAAASPGHSLRVVRRVADALRSHVRDFDVLARTADGEFCVLMPEPGPAPDERLAELARKVADDVRKDDRVNEPVRVALAFGLAVAGAEGDGRDAILSRAQAERIRMV
ncbi:MAG TPA: GAF domain-containing protein [Myxococcota bacterium]|nr:GAF domain-containing protein [Myxococcota bacterium]